MPNRNPVYDEWGQPHNALTGNPLYENSAPQKSAGESLHDIAMSVPNMLIEPVRALNRLSEHGGFPNPSDPQNKQDMSALVMSMFGGNALAPARAGEAVAARALSDAGKPSLMGSALAGAENHLPMDLADYGRAAYLEARHPFEKTTIPPVLADSFGELARLEQKARNGRQTVGASDHLIDKLSEWERTGGSPFNDEGAGINPYEATALNAQIRQNKVRTGTLFSDTGKPSLMGSALAGAEGKNLPGSFGVSPLEIETLRKAYGNHEPLPDEWYVHGRSNGETLSGDYPIQMTKDYGVMEQYGKKRGSGWAIAPTSRANSLDFSSIETPDIRSAAAALLRDSRASNNPIIDDVKNSTGGVSPKEISEHVLSSLSPDDIVNSAQAFDNPDWYDALRRIKNPDFIKTPDGAVGFLNEGPSNGIKAVRLFSDTGKPSALGAAMAGANQNQQQPTTADLLAILHKHGVNF